MSEPACVPVVHWNAHRRHMGPLAAVQHASGNTDGNQAAAGTVHTGAQCIKSWLGTGKWDVIT
jgi:hypothetical protein